MYCSSGGSCLRLNFCINAFIFCVHSLWHIGRVYVFYVGHVDKSSLFETLFHCNILSKHHHHLRLRKLVWRYTECRYIYICICIYIYAFICMHIYKYVFVCICIHISMYLYVYIYRYIHVNICIYLNIYA
jgi:hypothetical protein